MKFETNFERSVYLNTCKFLVYFRYIYMKNGKLIYLDVIRSYLFKTKFDPHVVIQ